MKIPNTTKAYLREVSFLRKTHRQKAAMSLAVGGNFDAIGLLEYYLLRNTGLTKSHTVIDVGCGSGRLAVRLASFLEGTYMGIDVVPDLVQYAESLCNRPDWTFSIAPGLSIPADDRWADFVCFFSVFTHLLHEDSYRYLREAKRVLKPDGRIVFSFLQFAVPSHWWVFKNFLKDTEPDKVHVQFMSVDAIKTWVDHLNLKIEAMYDGDKPHIPLDEVVYLENGQKMTELGNLGQSVCILSHDDS